MALAAPRIVVEALLPWFEERARPLPWRTDPSPYRVLLSELMLQQTRVETVVPYFERFVARWPTLADLAAAEEEEVLHAWAGLGYYRRARHLLACAREAVARGGLPDRPEELRRLPGIGPYTAGAIASIAFGRRAPLVDGNVERVLCRLDGRGEDPRAAAGRRALWDRAEDLHRALAPDEDPGALNQALMELGATTCLPREPACARCPVAAGCVARAEGAPERYPARRRRTAPTPVWAAYGLARVDQGWVLGRRPAGLLGGLWEPIGTEHEATEAPERAVIRAFRERAGLEARNPTALGRVRHLFSHRDLRATVFAVDVDGPPTEARWYTEVLAVRTPGALPLSTLATKLLAHRPERG